MTNKNHEIAEKLIKYYWIWIPIVFGILLTIIL
jgi:hypothetical protein